MFPPRKPVAAAATAAGDPAKVSPPNLAYHLQPVSTAQYPMPQRMDTVTSNGGKFSVSPASSIHEDDDEDLYGLGGAAGKEMGFTPSPTRYRSTAQVQGGWVGGGSARGTAAAAGRQSDPKALALWQTRPEPNDIPLPAPPHWRGSRDLQELADARLRTTQSGQAPSRTSYGPAPVLASVPEPAPAVIAAGNEITPAAPSVPWQSRREERTPPGQHNGRQNLEQGGVRSDSAGPFMHYEDIDYFGPEAESEPKDESQVDGALPRADTFPELPEILDRPRARRSWDRQRRRRRKIDPGPRGPGGRGKRREGGGFGAFWRYCVNWLPEILCCLLGIACFAIIIAVLKTYDGRGLTDWPLTVSLNTLVAFLAAICQVALSVPLTEGLSQLKWNSFARGEKPLADFQTFEDAKRWPLVGSAILLCKRKGRCEKTRP